eukprot:3187272-Prymnesium_polylepis.1
MCTFPTKPFIVAGGQTEATSGAVGSVYYFLASAQAPTCKNTQATHKTRPYAAQGPRSEKDQKEPRSL